MTYLYKITKEKYRVMRQKNCFWEGKISKIATLENIKFEKLTRFTFGGNIVYSIDGKLVVKLFPSYVNDEFVQEKKVLEHLNRQKLSVEIPKLITTGQFEGWNYIIMSELKGTLLIDLFDSLTKIEKEQIAADLGKLIKEVHRSTESINKEDLDSWNYFLAEQFEKLKEHHKNAGIRDELYEQLIDYVDAKSIQQTDKLVLLTGEYTPFNLIMNNENGLWKISGLIDFADCFVGNAKYDLLGPIAFMFFPTKGLNRIFLESYGFKKEDLNESFQKELLTFLLLHRFSNISYYQEKLEAAKEAKSFEELKDIFFNVE